MQPRHESLPIRLDPLKEAIFCYLCSDPSNRSGPPVGQLILVPQGL